ncbi:hypothetical protein [Erythrobacter crassostreae]|uniref:Uncharacterized protein n=1 Tax=Erythrobacter crassostreae TaxID=2828328 RepID=A0A9X1JNC1_9SPHN|nr:hypothetical protein [Erythrobacter crassostrea]MBV7260304.1 hypothetical protein [Erythrobacter crassostrea]
MKIHSPITSPDPDDQERGEDLLKDLIVISSYDQISALDAPVFDPSATVKLVPYKEELAVGLLLGGDERMALGIFAEALRQVMQCFSRFEPMNQTPIHRSYPSPRSLFPATAQIVFVRDGVDHPFTYEPEHHALCGGFETLTEGEYDLRLDIVGDLQRISPLYGDLGPTLCALETGHLLEQLRDTLGALGHTVRSELSGSDWFGPHSQNGNSLESIFPIASLILEDGRFNWSPEESGRLAKLRVPVPQLNKADRGRVATAIGRLVCPPAPAVSLKPGRSAGLGATLSASEAQGFQRSSGHFPFGIFGAPTGSEERDALIDQCHQAFQDLCSEWPDHQISAHLLMPQPGDQVRKINLRDKQSYAFPEANQQKLADAFGTSFNIDLNTIPAILLFSARFADFVNAKSSWPYIQTLGAAGTVAQRICVNASSLGFFARPFKGVMAKKIENGFAMDGQVFYSVILGKRRAWQPYYSFEQI